MGAEVSFSTTIFMYMYLAGLNSERVNDGVLVGFGFNGSLRRRFILY